MTDISPLSTVPASDPIEAIFAANPRELTDAQHRQLLVEIRRRRSAFLADEAAKLAKPAKAKSAKPPVSAPSAAVADKPTAELTLDDLLG